MAVLERNSSVPLYHQVANFLREKIQNGYLKPGEQIPSEWDLVKELQISRMTVRQAIAELVSEGLLYRRSGKGTFVASRKISSQLTTMIGFSEKMARQGLKVTSRVLNMGLVKAGTTVAHNLNLSPGEQVIEIKRLRLVEGEPAVLQWSYLPFPRCAAILDADLAAGSLLKTLQQKCGLRLLRSRDIVAPTIARGEEARLLGVKEGTPLLLVEGVLYGEGEEPLRYGKGLYRGDKFKLTVENYQVLSK